MSMKASDYSCVPLFWSCHREYDSGRAAFERKHGIRMLEIVKQLNAEWKLQLMKGEVPVKKIQFQKNIDVEVALQFATLKACPSHFENSPPQYMFTTVDGRIGFVPRIVADKIAALNLNPGEPIDICKKEVIRGQRRGIEWQVSRAGVPQNPPPLALPTEPAEQPSELENQLQRSLDHVTGHKKEQGPATARSADYQPNGTGTGMIVPQNGETETPQSQDTRSPGQVNTRQVPTRVPYDQAMQHFLIVAGRATRHAEKTLGAEGGSVRFDSRDVAALATTLLIRAFDRNWLTASPEWPGIGGVR